ncbi:DUF1697 domain-containing protein [Gordonia terrae]|uniref:DUF1697 domain-containing protein n=1 Tax=Gordonia terrae TaxID=2055 RepID=UPI003F6D6A1A
MTRRIILIRAVNVGGAKLPMSELRSIAAELGATEVSTYIASGNLICAPPGDSDEFDRSLEAALEERYGWFREVISRTPEQVRGALAAHPFEVVDDKYSYVYFLTGAPAPDKAAAFAERDFDGDVCQVVGTDLHIRYADGAGRSKLTAPVIARGLGVQGTGRNLRTVRTLLDLSTSP